MSLQQMKSALRLALLVIAAISLFAGAVNGQQPGAAPYRVGGNIPPPIKIKDVRPTYPPEAQQARVQGVVILEITVDTDGTVKDVIVLRSIPLLDQAAVD